MSVVRLEHLTKIFPGGTKAVDDLCLDIGDGEFLVLVGPSGCGKSTVLRMIAGLEDVSAGDVVIDGDSVTDWAPKERDIAMVFQNYALYPHMTVGRTWGSP
jgi:multiple sugar transport system ATP-binding protein